MQHWRGIHQLSPGAGADRPAPQQPDGRAGHFRTPARSGRIDERRSLFSAVSVYCRRIVDPEDIVTGTTRGHRPPHEPAAQLYCCCQKTYSRASSKVADVEHGARQGGRTSRSVEQRCALPTGRSPSSPVNRSRDDARTELEELRADVAWIRRTVPDAKEQSQGRGGILVGAGRHRRDGAPGRRERYRRQRYASWSAPA